MAQAAVPLIQTAMTAAATMYAAKKSAPKVKDPEEAPTADDAQRRVAAEREMKQRYGNMGAKSTSLSNSSKLG